jgi:hypothetical protein
MTKKLFISNVSCKATIVSYHLTEDEITIWFRTHLAIIKITTENSEFDKINRGMIGDYLEDNDSVIKINYSIQFNSETDVSYKLHRIEQCDEYTLTPYCKECRSTYLEELSKTLQHISTLPEREQFNALIASIV